MRTRRRLVPIVGVGLLVMSLVIVMGLRSRTLAQKDSPSPFSDSHKEELAKPSEPALAIPANEAVPPIGGPSNESPAPAGDLAMPPSVEPAAPARASAQPAEPRKAPSVVQRVRSRNEADPEKAAEEFLARSRKEADTAIKSLSAEAEELRARLKKVEAGLKRWQTLQAALNQSSGNVVDGKPAWRQGQDPQVLAPAEPQAVAEGAFASPPPIESTPAAPTKPPVERAEEPAQKK